ncbi:MAG: rod shape-determining protein MreC [Ruminiclostridium sp.]|nr:rod shape-determining protein MreC [Ruminiclostridium sp.]
MRDFFSSVKFKIIVCIFALVLGVVIYAAVSGGFSTIPETVITTITKPFVEASNAISNWVEDSLDKFTNADKYKNENEELKAKLNEIYKGIIDYDALKSENEQLKEILKIKEENKDFEFSAPCNIIAHNSNDVYGGFTIDRGSDDGISLYDPVMTADGLVGMVSEIGPNFAKVTTVISNEINIGIMTLESKAVGVINNDVEHANAGECLMSYIDNPENIKKGEIIKSVAGVIFPADLLVGTVKEIYIENGLAVRVTVQPAVDVHKITDCVVITHFKGQGVVD